MGFVVLAGIYAGFAIPYGVLHSPAVVPGMRFTPYGQVLGVLMLVADFLAGLLGLAVGWSIALGVHRQRLIAAIVCLVACASTATFALGSWNDKITDYGSDASKALVWLPLLILSGVALGGVMLFLAAHAVLMRDELSNGQA